MIFDILVVLKTDAVLSWGGSPHAFSGCQVASDGLAVIEAADEDPIGIGSVGGRMLVRGLRLSRTSGDDLVASTASSNQSLPAFAAIPRPAPGTRPLQAER